MAKNLVIVESPAKAKTIGKFLGSNYKVKASVGHIIDLPKSKLGVDIENNFEPGYITIRGKGPILAEIKKEAKKANKVFLATDPDREGEAISWHLANALKLEDNSLCRIEFHEITKDAIKKAIKIPRAVNTNLVDAQQARRVVDRLVGYQISPLLWRKIRKGLSAGRVQSVATKIICDREKDIESFIPQEYWSLEVLTSDENDNKINFKFSGKENEKMDINNEDEMNELLSKLKSNKILISNIEVKERKRKAANPFTTSTLQQEAANKLNFSTKKTMMLAQQLYEGIEVEDIGTVGLISYIRTDSIRISNEAQEKAKEYIDDVIGKEYFKGIKEDNKKKKSKIQDAHEAIRPTLIDKAPEMIKDSLSKDQFKLYKLIWERFISYFIKDAVYENISIKALIGDYDFKASGSKLKFDGFLKVYTFSQPEEIELSHVDKNTILKIKKFNPKQHFTQPPARYNEASLVKYLEEKGIGRPSTYAPIISTILARGYVSKKGNTLFPSELGVIVNEIMETHFKDIVNVKFTAEMEDRLDLIEEGNANWKEVVKDFYEPLNEDIKKAEEEIEEISMEEETDEVCEKCGMPMMIKYGRFGKFMACKNYPDCKNTKPILNKIGVNCPICEEGEVIERKTKKGRSFYGCSSYPKCNFISWNKPTGEICPNCKEKPLVFKSDKKHEYEVCMNKECGYKKIID